MIFDTKHDCIYLYIYFAFLLIVNLFCYCSILYDEKMLQLKIRELQLKIEILNVREINLTIFKEYFMKKI